MKIIIQICINIIYLGRIKSFNFFVNTFTDNIKYCPLILEFMKIDEKKCIGCGNCIFYCTVGAIYIERIQKGRIAKINEDECVECGICLRMMNRDATSPSLNREVCPTKAFYQDKLNYPRIIRQIFSDPTLVKKETGVFGRGTEEVKTLDVTRRISEYEAGLDVELGRPGIGTRLSEINKMTKTIAKFDVIFEHDNPLTPLMKDQKTGELRDEILNEKVLSAIIEFKTKLENVPQILDAIFRVKVNTVFVVGLYRITENGEKTNINNILKDAGYILSINGKANIGYGKRKEMEVNL